MGCRGATRSGSNTEENDLKLSCYRSVAHGHLAKPALVKTLHTDRGSRTMSSTEDSAREARTPIAEDCFEGYFRRQYGIQFTGKEISEQVKWFSTQYRVIRSKVEIEPCASILEVGSGLGGLLAMLPPDIDYTGLELDPEAVEFANNYLAPHTNRWVVSGIGRSPIT